MKINMKDTLNNMNHIFSSKRNFYILCFSTFIILALSIFHFSTYGQRFECISSLESMENSLEEDIEDMKEYCGYEYEKESISRYNYERYFYEKENSNGVETEIIFLVDPSDDIVSASIRQKTNSSEEYENLYSKYRSKLNSMDYVLEESNKESMEVPEEAYKETFVYEKMLDTSGNAQKEGDSIEELVTGEVKKVDKIEKMVDKQYSVLAGVKTLN